MNFEMMKVVTFKLSFPLHNLFFFKCWYVLFWKKKAKSYVV